MRGTDTNSCQAPCPWVRCQLLLSCFICCDIHGQSSHVTHQAQLRSFRSERGKEAEVGKVPQS